jgi:hypothetical protein
MQWNACVATDLMNTNSNTEDVFMTFDEFLKDSKPSSLFKEVSQEIAKDKLESLTADNRRDDEWSVLANQVVGRETL